MYCADVRQGNPKYGLRVMCNSPEMIHVCKLGTLDPIVVHSKDKDSCAEAGFSAIVTQSECQKAARILGSPMAKVKSNTRLPYCGFQKDFTFNSLELPETRGRYTCASDNWYAPKCVCKKGACPSNPFRKLLAHATHTLLCWCR